MNQLIRNECQETYVRIPPSSILDNVTVPRESVENGEDDMEGDG